jgi:hypothetical protein
MKRTSVPYCHSASSLKLLKFRKNIKMTSKKELTTPLTQKQNSLPIPIPANCVFKSSTRDWLYQKTKPSQSWLNGKIKPFKD